VIVPARSLGHDQRTKHDTISAATSSRRGEARGRRDAGARSRPEPPFHINQP
jgi:hypothetical protein